ncbi:MAG: 6-pyruvoyl tetrahydropterin synthase family protein [Armatimonadetes bacterium]|nr:6-pyruvoyl tetrahydropterin synthase family protein [Armatimonadota bacterium]
MFRVTKTFYWEAAHLLPLVPRDHKCGQLHGHSFRAEITLESDILRADGFIRDLAELAPVAKFIRENWDDSLLTISTEEMAVKLFDKAREACPETKRVRVYEGRTIWAEFEAHL